MSSSNDNKNVLKTSPVLPLKLIFLDIDGVLLPFPKTNENFPLEEQTRSRQLFPSTTLEPLLRLWQQTQTQAQTRAQTTSSTSTSTSTSPLSNCDTTTQWILSSTWRVRDDYIKDIEEALQEFGIGIGIGIGIIGNNNSNFEFSDITNPNSHSERQWEIFEYLVGKQREDPLRKIVWLAIDDEELIKGDVNQQYQATFQGHVCQTTSSVGLTQSNVDQALQLWKAQLQSLSNVQVNDLDNDNVTTTNNSDD